MSSFQSRPLKKIYKDVTFTGSNTTVTTPIFRVTGVVHVTKIYGIVTTVLGANHTTAYFRQNDQTAQVNITSSAGVTLSAAPVGSIVLKKALGAAAASSGTSSAGRVSEPTTAETDVFSPFVCVKKNGANTDIEYLYTTTDTPTSGVIRFFIEYEALSDDGAIAAL